MNKQAKAAEYLFRWIRLGQIGITIEKLIQSRGFCRIALYGYDKIAECLIYELENSTVKVEGIIDKKGRGVYIDFPAYTLIEASNLDIDAVIICPVDDYQVIKSDINKILDVPLISFEELIYEL